MGETFIRRSQWSWTLEALDTLAEGDELLLLLYCQPHPLFNVLRNNGYAWREEVRDDGTHEIRIHKLLG